MADPILPRRTTTAGKVPTTADLIDGELGANIADGRLFMRNGTGIVEFTAPQPFTEVTASTYTLAAGDQVNGIRCTVASDGACAVTIPPNSSVAFPRYCRVPVRAGNSGVVTVSAGTGVTVNAPNGATCSGAGDARVLEQTDIDVWTVW